MPNTENSQSNYTLIKLIRTGISPLMAMIGTSAYYGQVIANPVLASINALLFSKKLGIDIWNLNQISSLKSKLLNSSKKIVLGLGTIGLANYSKYSTDVITPIIPTTQIPTTTEIITTTSTTKSPIPPNLYVGINSLENNVNNNSSNLMDWDTYLSLNAYGIANLIAGITELIPSKFETIRKIVNMATGGCLISSGVAMGINNNFNNAFAIPTIIAGVSELIHNLLPMETNRNHIEMQETSFTDETRRLINNETNSDILNWNSIIENARNSNDNFTINSETSSQYGSVDLNNPRLQFNERYYNL